MRRIIPIAAVLFAILFGAWFPHGFVGVSPGWHQLFLGGGGWEVGSDFPPTGVRFIRADASGPYIWNTTTSKWTQLVCQVCIPANSTPGAYNFLFYPSTGANQVLIGPTPGLGGPGALGIVGAWNDSTVAYMFISGHVLVSTAIDPANPQNVAWVDTSPIYYTAVTNATWASTGGGQATFTVTRLPNQFAAGSFFKIDGMTPSGYNGNYTAISIGAGTVIASLVSNPGSFSSGGALHSSTSDYHISDSRLMGQALAVDPNNKDHVVVSTQYDGIFETFNGTSGGSATWAPFASGVPVKYNTGSQGTSQIGLIAFDPNSGTTVCGTAVCTNTVYVFTPGTPAGVYQTTTTTTGSWALMSGSPGTANDLKVTSATIGQGDVWVADGSQGSTDGNIWQYTGGAWNKRVSLCCKATSVNPLNGNQVIGSNTKKLYVSTNGGASFTNYLAGITATDAPWQGWMAARTSLAEGSIAFDPIVNGQIWFTGGQGVWSTPSLPSAAFNWVSTVAGIETLEGLSGIAVASAYHPSFGAQDESGCQFNILTNATTHPASCFPLAASKPLTYFSNLYVPPANPNFMVGKANYNFAAPEFSGYSTDGFASSYLPFNTWNTTVAGSALSNNSGAVEVAVSSTASLTTWTAGNAGSANSIICGMPTTVTRNPTLAESTFGGVGWACYTITVNDATHFTFNHSVFANLGNPLAAHFMFFAPATTLFSSWNGAFALTNIVDDGTGKVKVTVANSISNEIAVGHPVCISGVTMSGASVINGCWMVSASSSGNITLQDSTFAGGDTYTTGGLLTTWNLPDGSIAAATDQNIVIAAADNGILQCSLDGGQTWANNQPIPYTLTTIINGPFTSGGTTIDVANTSGLTSNNTALTVYLDDGRPFYVKTVGSAVGNTLTLAVAIPPGASITAGNAVFTMSGYGFAGYGNIQYLAADQVTANTFYAFNDQAGLYKWTNCATPTLVNSSGTWRAGISLGGQLKAVPGEAGHLFFASGAVGSAGASHPANPRFWRACNGDSNSAVTMQIVTGFWEVRAFGFGKAYAGQNYPSEWVNGWYASDNVQAHSVFGTFLSKDDPNHGNSGGSATCTGGQTWQQICTNGTLVTPGTCPTTGGVPQIQPDPGWNYTFQSLSGDPYVTGVVYGATVSGWYYGYFP